MPHKETQISEPTPRLRNTRRILAIGAGLAGSAVLAALCVPAGPETHQDENSRIHNELNEFLETDKGGVMHGTFTCPDGTRVEYVASESVSNAELESNLCGR